MDINYEKVLKYSKQVANRFFSDQDTVQEMAQLTAIQFFLNENRIDSAKTDNWLFTVTKNFCLKRMKDKQIDQEINLDPMILEGYPDNSPEYIEQDIDINSYDFLSNKDKIILQNYYLEHLTLSEIARNYKIELKKLKTRIYRLTQEMLLFHRMKENFFAPSIAGTKMHNAIYYTVQKFKKSIEDNQVECFINSLQDCKINDCFNSIKIRTILSISISFGVKDYYQALIVYKDLDNEIKAFLFKFVLTNKSKLKIIEIPILPILVATCQKKDIPPELENDKKFPLRNGKSRITAELLDQLIEKKALRVVQRRDDVKEINPK